MHKLGGRPVLGKKLEADRRRIEFLARYCGLKFHPVVFEMLSEGEMDAVVAYSGFPIRYHLWRWGQYFILQKKERKWGLGRIYELVIPTNPVYAYLVLTNKEVDQKTVMAHVFGHADFSRNNVWFRDIPENLHERFAENAERIEAIRHEIGREKADKFLEACLSLDNLFDPLENFGLEKIIYAGKREEDETTEPERLVSVDKLPSYMDKVLNPPEWIQAQRKKLEEEAARRSQVERGLKVPDRPIRDVLGFLLLHAPLEEWQQEIVRIIREESIAFKGMALTKIMNEGWAAYWHGHIMARLGGAADSEVFDFTRMDSRVLASPGLNPYRLGYRIWEDIKWRWDTGRHGSIWEDCRNSDILDRWDEFIVFKSLFDKHGGMNGKTLQEWREFETLVGETIEGRGFAKVAFFSPDDYVSEWLKYLEAESRLEALGKLSKEYQSEKFVKVEIKRYEFYREFKWKIRGGEIPVSKKNIPEEWIDWAKNNEFIGKLGQGTEKMFEIRATYNDVSFIEDFFTKEFCRRHGYHTVGIDDIEWEKHYVIQSRDYLRIKAYILNQIINIGQPKVVVYDANFRNNGELRLVHLHDGRNLDLLEMREVLGRLYMVWGRGKPIHLETAVLIWPKQAEWWETFPEKPGLPKPEFNWVRATYDGTKDPQKRYSPEALNIQDVPEDLRSSIPVLQLLKKNDDETKKLSR